MTKITPNSEDYEAIYRQHGRPAWNATEEELAHLYQLAQAAKIIRLYGPKINAASDHQQPLPMGAFRFPTAGNS